MRLKANARTASHMALVALVLTSACQPESAGIGVGSVDLTEDLHHRMRAGVFLADREPLVVRVVAMQSSPQDMDNVPPALLDIVTDIGTVRAQSNSHGRVVLYIDDGAALSHVRIATSTPDAVLVREFVRYPVHPIR